MFRCNVSLRGNGLKVLTANSFIPSDTPVIECRGKYMLNNPGLIKVNHRADCPHDTLTKSLLLQASKNNPYVLQHKLNNELEVLVDGTTYGNDSRYEEDWRCRGQLLIFLLQILPASQPELGREQCCYPASSGEGKFTSLHRGLTQY